jgi:hypothetical protein
MMKKTILYILTIVFFTGCVNEPKKEIENIERKEIVNPFIGNWESLERVYPYKSYLIIDTDSTFYFEYGACLASGFSNGKWTMNDSIIKLNSDKIDSCMYLSHFGQDCIVIDENDTSEFIVEKTISDCNPKSGEDYIEFFNEEFYIDNDTLKHIVKKSKLCPEIRNDFSRIKKDTTANKSYTQ